MSVTALSFVSSSETRVSDSFSSVMSLTLPLKSNRWRISFTACCTAFETSIRLTSDTTSNELSPAMALPPPVIARGPRDENETGSVADGRSLPACTSRYSMRLVRSGSPASSDGPFARTPRTPT
jgi:hypothetical protein